MPGTHRLTLAGIAAAVSAAVLLSHGASTTAESAVARRVESTPPSIVEAPTDPLPAVEPIGPRETEVATATGDHLAVYQAIPDEALAAPGAAVRMGDLPDVVFTPERDAAPEIPSYEQPVDGRRRTDDGWAFDNPTPWGNPLTFAVTERRGSWVRVLLPVRPNGTQGWVAYADVSLSVIDTRVIVDLGDATLAAFAGDNEIARSDVTIGRSVTPTPTGRFFVTDYDQKSRGSAYGPWILPLSGFSQAMDTFAGGVPVIALHGTNHPELTGGAHSNGCIRMPDDVIDLLRLRLPLGTPVDIVG